MCGFVGFLSPVVDHSLSQQIASASNTLIHRGPDADGSFLDESFGVSFRRLAIIDLTDSGNQPMISRNGRYILAFNGEIYNFRDLKIFLGKEFSNLKSDSAVLLELISELGILKAIQKLEGMFSISIWDKQSKEITLIRDRAGEKPLYFGQSNKLFVFGSEIQIFKEFKNFSLEIDNLSIKKFVTFSSVPAPKTIYKDVYKVLPGHMIKISLNDVKNSLNNVKQFPYWQITDQQPDKEAAKELMKSGHLDNLQTIGDLIESKVVDQMISDAPLGAFLSGGIDSSLIVALMQKNSIKKIKTFSIGFEDQEYNEANHARAVAEHLKTDHTEYILTESDLYKNFYQVIDSFDEPHSDSSNLPTSLLSSLAKQDVTVALSGDGGDELFGGYSRHAFVPLWNKLNSLPGPLLNLLCRSAFQLISQFENLSFISKPNIEKAYSVLNAIDGANDINHLHTGFLSNYVCQDFFLINNSVLYSENIYNLSKFKDDQTKMMALDFLTFLPNLVLTKVDRASMSHSLETRAPFLNHHIIDQAFNLPISLKINSSASKLPLRNLLYKYVPQNIIERPKMGFGIPRKNFLRGYLSDAVHSLHSSYQLKKLDVFNLGEIGRFVDKKFQHNTYNDEFIWALIVLDRWLNKNN